jgi:DNA-binding XRE family transcriptional regulator
MNQNVRLIYAMRNLDSGLIKIGVSYDPRHRASILSVTENALIEIIGVASGTMQHENMLHQKFADSCFQGEWFHPNPDVLEFVNSLPKYNNEWVNKDGVIIARIPGVEKFISWDDIFHDCQRNGETISTAEDLRKKRKIAGFTQAQIAEQIGVHHSIISRMERGEIPINLRTLIALEAVFTKAREQ